MNHDDKMEAFAARIANALERLATAQEEHNSCIAKALDNGVRIPVDVTGELRKSS